MIQIKTKSMVLTVALAAVAIVGGAPEAVSDHIPGHDDSDPVFPVPIPGPEFFTGGILFVTAIGPDEGTVITGTTFDITYVSDGATPASDILIHVGVQLESGEVSTFITGADLGFTSGPGTFKGTYSTDVLNGVVVGVIGRQSIVDLEIGAVDGGIEGTGFFDDSFINFDVIPIVPAIMGDMNCDDELSTADIAPFVLALRDPNRYELVFDDCDISRGDFNGDGEVNGLDISGFVAAMTSP